jgi:hypothetical protein
MLSELRTQLTSAGLALTASAALGLGIATTPAAPVLVALLLIGALVVVALASRTPIFRLEATPSPRLASIALGGLIALVALYTLSFNAISNRTRLEVAGVVALGLVVVAVERIAHGGALGGRLFAAAGAPFVITAVGGLVGVSALHLTATLRVMFPFVLGAALIARPEVVPRRFMAWVAALLILLGAAISFSHGKVFLDDQTRLSPFTGGVVDGAHSSAYVMVVCAMILNEVRRQRLLRASIAWPIIALAGLALYEYKVATAAVMLIVYFALRGLLSARTGNHRILMVGLLVVIAVAGYQMRVQQKQSQVYGSRSTNVANLSSGRLVVWTQRLQLIDGRSAGLLLLGSGTGTDLFQTDVWGGASKDSHNDFLTFFIEHGLLGLSACVAFLALAIRAAGRPGLPVLGAMVVSSLLSNALLARPMVAPFLWVAVALAVRGGPQEGVAERSLASAEKLGRAVLSRSARGRPNAAGGPVFLESSQPGS